MSLSVGFDYMANACGRLLGTLLSGVLYQVAGVRVVLGCGGSRCGGGPERCSCRPLRTRSTGAEQKGPSGLGVVATAGIGGSQLKV